MAHAMQDLCIQNTEFLVVKHIKCFIQDKTGQSRVMKTKVTVTSVPVVTTKTLCGMCNCTVDSDGGTYNVLLVAGT